MTPNKNRYDMTTIRCESSSSRYDNACVRFVRNEFTKNDYASTKKWIFLTFHIARSVPIFERTIDGKKRVNTAITRDESDASRTFDSFMRAINKSVYGKRYKSRSSLMYHGVLKLNKDASRTHPKYHVHILLEVPSYVPQNEPFEDLIERIYKNNPGLSQGKESLRIEPVLSDENAIRINTYDFNPDREIVVLTLSSLTTNEERLTA